MEVDWVQAARELGPGFAQRAAQFDEADAFVAQNYAELKACGLIEAAVPRELGGGGASHAALCAMLRELARHCSSTALAFAMHTHQAAILAWRWRHQGAPVEGLLKRVAAERIVLATSGGSDWLLGSGEAVQVPGGYRVSGRKIFVSGAPAGDVFLTTAVLRQAADPEATVLHFAVAMKDSGVETIPTWRVMGMRGTASHDVALREVFVADAAISARRPSGVWDPLMHLVAMTAIPMIYSVYVGVAEAAREAAARAAGKRRSGEHVEYLMGGVENEVAMARLAWQDMIAAAAAGEPGFDITNRVMTGRTLVARGVLNAVELAMECAGGSSFYRAAGLERLFRDAQGARFHALQEGVQRRFAGRLALGRTVESVG